MTAYQGGKKRIGKFIYEIISSYSNKIDPSNKMNYFEPFHGMGGVMCHFAKENKRILLANDKNKDLILLWKAIQNDWAPPSSISKEEYNLLKNSKEHSALRGFVGIVCSWGGIWFHNYRLKYQKNNKDFIKEGINGLNKIKDDMKHVVFDSKCYSEYSPKNQIIYCDPPYKGNNLKSTSFKGFDHEKFWNIMREWSKDNLVFISESSAPDDFEKIWEKTSYSTNQHKNKKYSDCLFIKKT
jgi:site-specific DNA-adenine methylase